jgi:hypothetical protein
MSAGESISSNEQPILAMTNPVSPWIRVNHEPMETYDIYIKCLIYK